MTELTQVPFADLTFVDNPEPRCPCVLLLDTSSSMSGPSIDQLNAGLHQFQKELANDALASQRVEIAVITFGPVQVVQDFITADHTISKLSRCRAKDCDRKQRIFDWDSGIGLFQQYRHLADISLLWIQRTQ